MPSSTRKAQRCDGRRCCRVEQVGGGDDQCFQATQKVDELNEMLSLKNGTKRDALLLGFSFHFVFALCDAN